MSLPVFSVLLPEIWSVTMAEMSAWSASEIWMTRSEKYRNAWSIAVFIITLILWRVKNDNRILLIVRAEKALERSIESSVFTYFQRKALLKVKNTTKESVEFIYELSSKTYSLVNKNEKDITEVLYGLGAVEYVNVVTQSDEISG